MQNESQTPNTGLSGKDFAIGLLSTTATILLVGVLMLNSQVEQVSAGPMTETAGEYVLTVATKTQNDEEVLFLVNVPKDKLIAYRFDVAKSSIETLSGIDHAQSKAQGNQQGNQPRRGGRRGGNRRP